MKKVVNEDARHTISWIRWVAQPEDLAKFAKDDRRDIRIAVAKHDLTPAETLIELADDSDINVRNAVARNPNSPTKALEILWRNALPCDREMSTFISRHPNASPEILEEILESLSTSKDRSHNWYVLKNISLNPNTSQEVREEVRESLRN